jgi:ketosteroid isomerase-like protein
MEIDPTHPVITRLVDEAALKSLAYRYAAAVDRRDYDAFAGVFTEDGVLDAPGASYRGHEAVRGLLRTLSHRFLKTHHAVLNQLYVISESDARGETYCIARHLSSAPGKNLMCYEMTIRYQDHCVRSAAGWRFAHRVLNVDWTRIYPVREYETEFGSVDRSRLGS